MTLTQRLAGCPTGATLAALLLCGHAEEEIIRAVRSGAVRMEIRGYANPRGLQVQWYYLERANAND
jgi:hypothetical protein